MSTQSVMDDLHCGPREARLRCMAENRPDSSWFHLNAEDRDAIQWAFDRIKTLEDDLVRSRERQSESWSYVAKTRQRMEKLLEACQEALKAESVGGEAKS